MLNFWTGVCLPAVQTHAQTPSCTFLKQQVPFAKSQPAIFPNRVTSVPHFFLLQCTGWWVSLRFLGTEEGFSQRCNGGFIWHTKPTNFVGVSHWASSGAGVEA